VAKQLNQGVAHLMKKNKITVVMGEGKLTAKDKLSVAGADGKATELAAKHIIVATGARARDLPFAKADGKKIWTYRHAMTPPEMPTELLVIGSGAIGIEFASFYADLGAKVTVADDPDVGGSREPQGGRERRRGEDQDQRRQVGRTALQPLHRRRRDRSQYRGYRPGSARGEDDQGPYRH
jgi:NADPH-dependent 2,4-dienoyl-CoA reductase/sulfur reductase-like enzyme